MKSVATRRRTVWSLDEFSSTIFNWVDFSNAIQINSIPEIDEFWKEIIFSRNQREKMKAVDHENRVTSNQCLLVEMNRCIGETATDRPDSAEM